MLKAVGGVLVVAGIALLALNVRLLVVAGCVALLTLAASAVPNPRTVAFVLAYLLSAAVVTIPYLKWRARPAPGGAARPGG